jgi:hypothetical protein
MAQNKNRYTHTPTQQDIGTQCVHNLACLCTLVIKIHSRTRFYGLTRNVVAQMEMDDEFLDLLGVRAALGRRLRDAALLQRLEAAVAHRFPQRSAGRGLGAALVAAPLPGERNISEVTDAAVCVFFYFFMQIFYCDPMERERLLAASIAS